MNGGAGRCAYIVGIAAGAGQGSSTERAVGDALRAAEALGATTAMFDTSFLRALPIYDGASQQRTLEETALVDAVRQCDGVIVGTPAYHGGISGLVKNALDLLEDLSKEPISYLDGRAFGCIVSAAGWQGAGTTLVALRSIAHALRAWPTPLGVTLNSAAPVMDGDTERRGAQLGALAQQVVWFAERRGASGPARPVP